MIYNANLEELLVIYKNGSKYEKELAMEAIITENDNLILHIINKYFSSYRHHHIEDMRQEGREALFKNVINYDASRGQFSTFITPYIIDAIKNYICMTHGISTHYAGQIKKYRKAIESLKARGVENPTYGEIAEEMNVGIDAVQRVYEIANRINPVSIEGDEKEKELCSPYNSSPDAVFEKEESKKTLFSAIDGLPKGEKEVIKLIFFSESSNEELPLADVAKRLKMDVSQVRRLKNLGLRRLKNELEMQSDDMKTTRQRRTLEDYAEGLTVSFTLPENVVEMNIDIAYQLGDEEELTEIAL